jgi:zinc transport system ATP-binding protein
MSAPAPLLSCDRLLVGYNGHAVLPPLTLDLAEGQFWAVIGRNGAGKSTFFKTLLGLLPPVGGACQRASGGVSIAYVPQRYAFDPIYPVTAWDVVAMGVDRGWSFLKPTRDAAAVDTALAEVDASGLGGQLFRSLSEGQKQRVLLARVLASGARLVLLDEPTAAMDAVAQKESMVRLDALRRKHDLCVVMVSHHLPIAFRYADHMVFLDPDADTVLVGEPEHIKHLPAFHDRYGASAAEVCGG